MKNFIYLFMCCVCFAGCSSKTGNSKQIIIGECPSVPIDFSSLSYEVDTIGLTFMEGSYISMIKDICFNDSLVYVADFSNSLSVFNIKSGNMIKQIHGTGHGHGEYTDITAISINSNEVYLLDQPSMAVLVYNKYLEYTTKIEIPFPAIDFEAVSSGFLFYNMNASTQYKRIVYTNERGDVMKAYLDTDPLPDHLYTPHFLSKVNSETAYISDSQSNSIYVWKNGDVKKLYNFKRKSKKSSNEGSLGVKHSFVTDNHVITCLSFDKKECFNIYEINKDSGTLGLFDINSGRPFSPMSQYGNVMAGVFASEDLRELPNWNSGRFEASDLIMFLYHF